MLEPKEPGVSYLQYQSLMETFDSIPLRLELRVRLGRKLARGLARRE